MLARTSAMHTFSEFFVGKPTAADPDLWQHVEHAPPIECPDQDEGYFDIIMRFGPRRPVRRCISIGPK